MSLSHLMSQDNIVVAGLVALILFLFVSARAHRSDAERKRRADRDDVLNRLRRM